MNAKELKSKLHEGEVEFTYRKKDGSERKARGTLCEKLMPKVDPIVARFSVKVDEWAQSENMPKRKKFKVGVTQKEIDELGEDAMDNVVQAAIEKKFCHKVEEFSYWPLEDHDEEPKKLPEGTIFYYDLDKGGFRSFNEDQLIG